MKIAATEPIFGIYVGEVNLTVHAPEVCEGDDFPCVIHRPSKHHMSDWPTLWRADRKLMERTCPHGVGHPDPDDLAFHVRNGRAWQASHGCDGCCQPAVTVQIIKLEGRFFPQTCCGVEYTNSKDLMDHFLPVHMVEGRRKAIEARLADLQKIELSLLNRMHSAREEITQLETTLQEM